jgi:hypothetical protein
MEKTIKFTNKRCEVIVSCFGDDDRISGGRL